MFFSLCLFIITNNWWFGYIALLNIGYLFSSLLPLSTSDGYHIFTIIYGSEGTRWQLLLLLAGVIKKKDLNFIKISKQKNDWIVSLFYSFICYWYCRDFFYYTYNIELSKRIWI